MLFDPSKSPIDRFRGEYAFASNFFPATVELEVGGVLLVFPTAEHAFHAHKRPSQALSFTNPLLTPAGAKRMGRAIRPPDWFGRSLDAMARVVNAKYRQHQDLADLLLATYPHQLIEGNFHGDRFWGQVDGHGENHLGRLTMETRLALYLERAT